MMIGRGSKDLSGPPPESYQTTYYPSAADPSEATPVDVTAGATVSGVDIRVIRSQAFPVRVSVLDQTGLSLGNLTLTLLQPGGGGMGYGARGPKGQFDLGPMPRGRLPVRVLAYNPQGPALWARYALDVNAPIDNLELAVKPGFTVSCRLRVEDAAIPKGLKFSLTIPDLPMEARYTMTAAEPAADGSLVFTNVSADRYSMAIGGMPRGFYVKSVRLGTQDALEDVLDLAQPPDRPVEIVLSAKPGAVKGTVSAISGAPVSGVTVVLVPQGARRRERADWYRTATTGADAKFVMTDLRPGDYKLFAWDDVEDGAWMDPVFLKPFEEKGQPVTIREGGSEDVKLMVTQ
jgi:hypothetical protein